MDDAIRGNSDVRLTLTDEQRKHVSRLTGFRSEFWAWPRSQFVALSMLAARAGYGGVPHGKTAATRFLSGAGDDKSGLLEVELTPVQRTVLGEIAGRDVATICFAADDYAIRYHEDWTTIQGPVTAGQRFVILGEEEENPGNGRDLEIRLARESGSGHSVFGTGTHPATRIALELMEQVPLAGARVLDVGTGSGILAVAAVRLGAEAVDAIDVSPEAVEVAEKTAACNGIADRIRVECGEWTAKRYGYQLIVANLFANELLRMAPALRERMDEGQYYITSGIVKARAEDIRQATVAAGLTEIVSAAEGEWIGILFQRDGTV